MRTAELHET